MTGGLVEAIQARLRRMADPGEWMVRPECCKAQIVTRMISTLFWRVWNSSRSVSSRSADDIDQDRVLRHILTFGGHGTGDGSQQASAFSQHVRRDKRA
jgi:hypothetical protein